MTTPFAERPSLGKLDDFVRAHPVLVMFGLALVCMVGLWFAMGAGGGSGTGSSRWSCRVARDAVAERTRLGTLGDVDVDRLANCVMP